MATTSGTVSTYPFNLMKVIDHAGRRAGRQPERVSGQDIQVARDLVFTLTSEWINAGYPLWTRQYLLLPITIGSVNVPLPVGINDVFHAYWRIINPFRGVATGTDSSDCSPLFSGQKVPAITLPSPNPGVIANFGTTLELDTIGVLIGGAVAINAALVMQTSQDGLTFTTVGRLPMNTYTPGVWSYFDLDPSITAPFVKLFYQAPSPWTLLQIQFGLANGQDIELGALNQDDYYNLPDKQFQNPRPVSSFLDRQLLNPVLKVWPAPDQAAFYNGTVTALARRYIQDPGLLTNNVEVPQRWLEALIWRLASLLMFEWPEDPQAQAASAQNPYAALSKQQRMQMILQMQQKAEALAWSEEVIAAPIRMSPNIGVYTR